MFKLTCRGTRSTSRSVRLVVGPGLNNLLQTVCRPYTPGPGLSGQVPPAMETAFVDLFIAQELKIAAYNMFEYLDQVKDGVLTIEDLEQLSQIVKVNGPDELQNWGAEFWSNMLTYFDFDGNNSIDRQEFFVGLVKHLVDTELHRKGKFDSQNSILDLIDAMRMFLNDALMSMLKNIAFSSCGKYQCSDSTVLENIFLSKIVATNEFGPIYAIEDQLKQPNSELALDIALKLDLIGNLIRQATDETFHKLDGNKDGLLDEDDFYNSQVPASIPSLRIFKACFVRLTRHS